MVIYCPYTSNKIKGQHHKCWIKPYSGQPWLDKTRSLFLSVFDKFDLKKR